MATQAAPSSSRPAYACVITRDWDPSLLESDPPALATPLLSVRRGDKAWVFVGSGGTFTGWVPISVIQSGQRQAQTLPIEIPFRGRVASAPSIAAQVPSDSVDILEETLRCLWRSIIANKDAIVGSIPGLSQQSQSVLFNDKASTYADAVFSSITPQARGLMRSGTFDLQAVSDLREVSSTYPKEPGIYFRIYERFGNRTVNDQVFSTALYIGQSVDINERDKQHRFQTTRNNKSNHYRLARQAKKAAMIPLILERHSESLEDFLHIAEFSMVCLFQSWYPNLYEPINSNLMGAYGADFDAAVVFSKIIREVSQQTGWAPTPAYGLNWNTPIIKNATATKKWLSWYQPEKQIYVYRSKRLIQVHQGTAPNIHWQGHDVIQVPTAIAEAASLKHGDSVHVIVEVRKNGDQYLTHPFRFGRMPPLVGRNPELEKLRAMAIKIQWLDPAGTGWNECYLEKSRIWNQMAQPWSHILKSFRKGLLILSDVEQTTYSNAPAWVPGRGPAPVQFLRYDHLQQKLIVENVRPRVVPWPQDRTIAENAARLSQMFPGPDTIVGPRPQPWFFGPSANRQICDMCYSQGTPTACKNNYDEDDQTCKSCRALNRPCTFTRGPAIRDQFIQEGALEELGISVSLLKERGAMISSMASPPFDPDLESEEHSAPGNN
ncbi:hypothetical protein BGZ61DRAFT_415241 [Ilyonectria robusta]|uniref:uncharacterized protein n=1 Tax=Ilyonectria robusta TaxID=1079257 RepID=UPI001E8E45AA|nr:uncharacterized protein BGZ61DRAFT_415241 [Ilyonectria robusta]KAH8729472.1 hypothetical protein BGZ61DRAFT_415241 [Ilyonectria robusta]